MKKIVILMLVLGLATAANAAVSWEFRDEAGTTAITSVDITSPNFTIVISGSYPAGGAGQFNLYDAVGPGGDADFVTGATPGPALGSLGALSILDTAFDGYTVNYADTAAQSGVVATLTLTALQIGLLTVDNWNTAFTEVLDSASIPIVPEPMTIALLGLGGLFIRRKK